MIGARCGKILAATEVRCEDGGNTTEANVGLDDTGCTIEAIAAAIKSETSWGVMRWADPVEEGPA